MSNIDYNIQTDTAIAHFPGNDSWLRDGNFWNRNLAIEALAASGDCFEMLASNLDQMSRALPASHPQQPQLESMISTLMYLQRHYKIIRKQSPHRT